LCAAGPTIGIKDLSLDRPRASDSQVGLPVVTADSVLLPGGLTLEEAERRYAKAVLDREGGNQSAAARALGVGGAELARLLKP
jgi:DNA-binding NtrC family response regulator